MAKPRSRDKFHVGQVVALVLDQKTGHEQYNNRITTVVAARVWGAWKCSDPLRKERGAEVCEDWRYAVRHPGDGSKWYVTEDAAIARVEDALRRGHVHEIDPPASLVEH